METLRRDGCGPEWLAARFEEQRPRLRAVARRMLGSEAEAEDAVQEAWLRLSRSDGAAIENLGGWLTTTVSRVCLNVLQSRRSHREVALEPDGPGAIAADEPGLDPEEEAVLADSVGLALLVVLDTLTPAERVAFVLHDLFAVPFAEIGPILGRAEPAVRQLASRARRRVRQDHQRREVDRLRQATLVEAFLAAARQRDYERLLSLLDPDIVLTGDRTAVSMGVRPELRGREAGGTMARWAGGGTPALLDGRPALVWVVSGRPRVVYSFTVAGGRFSRVDLIADPERLATLDLLLLEEWTVPDRGPGASS
jgi:RNA polymerase sigma-70 factor (ECF subfamily)